MHSEVKQKVYDKNCEKIVDKEEEIRYINGVQKTLNVFLWYRSSEELFLLVGSHQLSV